MAACNKLSGCVAAPHAHAGGAQGAPPPNPAPLPDPPRRPPPSRSPSLPQRPGLLSGWSSTGHEVRVTLEDLLGAGYCWQASGDALKEN
eukprot:1142442-Pelagomonas_calceolata.AAC.3